jgi:hypothetical protein
MGAMRFVMWRWWWGVGVELFRARQKKFWVMRQAGAGGTNAVSAQAAWKIVCSYSQTNLFFHDFTLL